MEELKNLTAKTEGKGRDKELGTFLQLSTTMIMIKMMMVVNNYLTLTVYQKLWAKSMACVV